MQSNLKPQQQLELILDKSQFDFRSVPSLVQESGLSKEKVEQALTSYPNIFRRPWGQPHAELFTLADRKVTKQERLSLGHALLTNRLIHHSKGSK